MDVLLLAVYFLALIKILLANLFGKGQSNPPF